MKKTWMALALVLMLLGLSVGSSLHLDRLTESILARLTQSEQYARLEQYEEAESALRQAMKDWESADIYTGIVLRHDQTEEVQDLFWDILSSLRSENLDEAAAEYGKLRTHLQNLDRMEQIRLQSIL